jgi:hypothetical protein
MKTTLLRLLAALSLLTTAVVAQGPSFVPASGLQISLSTGGYKFYVQDAPTTVAATNALKAKAKNLRALLPTNDGFAATVVLANFSRSPIPFTFPDSLGANVKFAFRILDSTGTQVWRSDADVLSAQSLVFSTLNPGARWKRTLQIPLKVNGAWLTPGTYTLEATFAADAGYSSKVGFVVLAALPPGADTGITGTVLDWPHGPILAGSGPVSSPVANAVVTITPIRQPGIFYIRAPDPYTTTTDADGKFTQLTPAGTYWVSAAAPAVVTPVTSAKLPRPLPPLGLVKVNVTEGQLSEVTLHISTGVAVPLISRP